jgi:hypothetical protein
VAKSFSERFQLVIAKSNLPGADGTPPEKPIGIIPEPLPHLRLRDGSFKRSTAQ